MSESANKIKLIDEEIEKYAAFNANFEKELNILRQQRTNEVINLFTEKKILGRCKWSLHTNSKYTSTLTAPYSNLNKEDHDLFFSAITGHHHNFVYDGVNVRYADGTFEINFSNHEKCLEFIKNNNIKLKNISRLQDDLSNFKKEIDHLQKFLDTQ